MKLKNLACLGVVAAALMCCLINGCTTVDSRAKLPTFEHSPHIEEIANYPAHAEPPIVLTSTKISKPTITTTPMPNGAIKIRVHYKVQQSCPNGSCPKVHKPVQRATNAKIAREDVNDMISFPSTLGQLRDAVNSYIEHLGENAPLGRRDGNYLDDVIQLEWVCIDESNHLIIGSEAEDTEMNLQPGQVNAIVIS